MGLIGYHRQLTQWYRTTQQRSLDGPLNASLTSILLRSITASTSSQLDIMNPTPPWQSLQLLSVPSCFSSDTRCSTSRWHLLASWSVLPPAFFLLCPNGQSHHKAREDWRCD